MAKQFTERHKDIFLRELKRTCNPTKAAEAAGMKLATFRAHKKKDEVFSALWEDALEEGLDLLEYEVKRRGFDGVKKAVYFQGLIIDEETEYSDSLAKFYLTAARPEKFRENHAMDLQLKGGVLVVPEVKGVDEWLKENEAKENDT